jgi:hypothetical protein
MADTQLAIKEAMLKVAIQQIDSVMEQQLSYHLQKYITGLGSIDLKQNIRCNSTSLLVNGQGKCSVYINCILNCILIYEKIGG